MSENEGVLQGAEEEMAVFSASEILAQMGQLAKSLEQSNPAMSKKIAKQVEALASKMTAQAPAFVEFDENTVLERIDEVVRDYQQSGADHMELIMIRGGEIRTTRFEAQNQYLTPTGKTKVLFPAREGTAGKNPQAILIEWGADGKSFTIEPSHAGVDWREHFQNKWK